jgi:hypothetical protein
MKTQLRIPGAEPRRLSPATILVALVLFGSCVLEAGCTGRESGSPEAAATSATVDGVSFRADLNQSRPQEGTRQINARLTNIGSDAVTVTGIRLETDQITSLPATPKDTTFVPGQVIDVASAYGRPRCHDPSITDASFAVTLSDGSTARVRIDRHGLAWLNRLYADECGVAAVHEVAAIAYGARFVRTTVDGEPALRGQLLVTRRPDAPATTLTVDGMAGSVLVKLLAAEQGSLPRTLEPNQRRLTIPILLEAFRCDPHARGGSTQTFLLSVYVKRGDDRQQRVILVPDKPLQARIFSMIDDSCSTRRG